MKHLLIFAHKVDSLNDWVGRMISWLALAMVVVTFLIVLLRYGFNIGYIAMQESVVYMHAIVFLLGASYTYRHNGHVRVDIIYRGLSPKKKAWVDFCGSLLLMFPVSMFILWISWGYVAESWSLTEGSREPGGIPFVYLLKSMIVLMAVLLVLQSLSEAVKHLSRIVAKERG